jgi:hypothetical protein
VRHRSRPDSDKGRILIDNPVSVRRRRRCCQRRGVQHVDHPLGLDGSRAPGDNNNMSITTTPSVALTARFHVLADEWRAATKFLSAPSAASEHPAYRAIVALGPDVVPLILTELATAPEPWFAALRELTGADPVPPTDRGRPQVAAEHWLAWGRARGLA